MPGPGLSIASVTGEPLTARLAGRATRATLAFGIALGLGGRAQADELGRQRAPVRLELDACLDRDHDAVQHAVRIEVGEDAPVPDDASAVAVRVECAADGLDSGVVLEVRQPGNPRRYRYALDWRAQPLDARPRLIGLAVAEAVAASRIELTAIPEPLPPAPGRGSIGAPGMPGVAADWTLALVGDQRTFSARGGADLLGVGVMPTRRLSTHLRLAADVLVENATALAESGAVAVLSVSSAPRIAYHIGGRRYGEVGLGARVGIVRMHGEALPHSQQVGESLIRLWFGPVATVGVGADLTPGVTVTARFELGIIETGATARDQGEPVASFGGMWTSFGLIAAIAL